MSYATNADVTGRLGTATAAQLTTASSSTTPDEDIITGARQGAEAEINGYLCKRYRVPINVSVHTHIGSLLKSKTLDLTVYELYQRKPPVPDDVVRAHEEDLKWLMAVAEGKVNLPGVDVEVEPSTADGPKVLTSGPPRIFSHDTTKGVG